MDPLLIRVPWDRHRKALCSWGQQDLWRTLSYTSKLGILLCLVGTESPHGWEWGTCACAGQRLQSLSFKAFSSVGHCHGISTTWMPGFNGLGWTGFLRCPHLWFGSNTHGMLGSCGKSREERDPASCGPAWLLPGAQSLQKLFLLIAMVLLQPQVDMSVAEPTSSTQISLLALSEPKNWRFTGF